MRAMPGNIGPLEIGVVLIIALLVFGPKRLPELGSSLGKGIREFKETISGDRADEDEPDDEVKALSASTATAESAEPEVTAADKRG
jgi:sec-independent protein translocase protein TatA